MKTETKPLSTADLANAGKHPTAESTDERARSAIGAPVNSGARNDTRLENRSGRSEVIDVDSRNTPLGGRGEPERPGGTAATPDASSAPLFEHKDAEGLRERWNQIQVGFVDEPRNAVVQADTLVAETIKRLADSFAGSRSQLEGEWDREGDVSTENLRIALQRYRSFFNRLLAL